VNHIATGRALSPGGRTTPSSSWETATSMEMAVKSMETAVVAMESMEMALGALPHPGRVPKQRLLSPEIHRWRRRSCGTSSGKTPIDLGFLRWRLLIGEGAMSEDGQGPQTMGWHALGVTHATRWCGCPLAPLQLFFVLRLVSGEIGTSGFISSNSENISCVTFLKHKNSRK
jgi:hypothetical protein